MDPRTTGASYLEDRTGKVSSKSARANLSTQQTEVRVRKDAPVFHLKCRFQALSSYC